MRNVFVIGICVIISGCAARFDTNGYYTKIKPDNTIYCYSYNKNIISYKPC
mgnify:CR=1 FL=1